MTERYTTRIGWRVTSTDELDTFEFDPSHIRGSPVPARLNELTNGRNNFLGAIFISRGQVNFITEHDELTSDLGRGQNNSVRSLEDELWGCRTG